MKAIKALQTFYVFLLCLLPLQLALGVSETEEISPIVHQGLEGAIEEISPLVPQGLEGASASEEVSSLVPNKPPFLNQGNNKLPFGTSSAGLVLDPPDQLLHKRGLQATLPWNQVGNDIEAEPVANDNFGLSVAMSKDGMRIAAGAHNNDGNGNGSGHVRVYDYIAASTSWVQVGNDIDGDSGSLFGHSVGMSGNGMRVACGALYGNHVRVYDWVASTSGGGSWVQVGNDIEGQGGFGYSLAMSEDGMRIVAGGAYYDNFKGIVMVFDYIAASNSWVQLGDSIYGDTASDNFGSAVATSGEGLRVAIGAWGHGPNSGQARVFDYSATSNSWVQVGNDIDGQEDNSQTGRSLAMSKDGKRLAVGSLGKHIRVYDEEDISSSGSSSWVKVGNDIPEGPGYAQTGTCVALSEDGTRMAAGSLENIRVFTSVSGSWVQVDNDIDVQNWDNISINSVAMSYDGLRVVIGAPWNDKIGTNAGLVTVFVDPNPTPSPTGSPTPAPTTPSPTGSPTFTPANQGSFEIHSTGDITGTATSDFTIDLKAPYNASNRVHKTTVLSPNCIQNFTGTAADAFNVTDSVDVSLGGGFISYESTIAVDISKVNGTEWWEDLPNAGALGGIFDVCLQSAVYFELPDGTIEKMNFVDTNVTVKVEMDANFNIASINAERKDAVKQDLTLDYSDYVTAYQCAEGIEGSEIVGQQYSQGDVLKICVKSTDSGIMQVGSIKSLTLSQIGTGAGGAFSYISNGVIADDEIAETACDTSTFPVHVCHADMQLLGRYFGVDEPGDLTASGSVELTFPTTGRRLTVDVPIAGIRGTSSGDVARRMEETSRTPSPEAASFNIKVSLEPTDGSGSNFFYGATSAVMSGLVAAAAGTILMV